MARIQILNAVEQVAGHLRREIGAGKRSGEMPGVVALAAQLGVNHKTVDAALGQLEQEGLLASGGSRRPRVIVPGVKPAARSLRVGILLCEPADSRVDYMVEIRHGLTEAGHIPFFAKKAITEIGYDIGRLERLVGSAEADAWVIQAATHEILEWFAVRPEPVFALFGHFIGLDVAATGGDMSGAFESAVKALVERGHRRIVLLARPGRKLPVPGLSERAYLAALEAEGIPVGDYHFPLWEESKAGFLRCLDSLFGLTPPTALVIEERMLFAAAQQFLATRCLRVPEDVSLICAEPDPNFLWQEPSVAHFGNDSAPWVNHLMRWVSHISQGRDYRRQILSKGEFIGGGTVGPVGKGGAGGGVAGAIASGGEDPPSSSAVTRRGLGGG